MKYVFRFNQSSTDKRVNALKELFMQKQYQTLGFDEKSSAKGIYFLEPRNTLDEKLGRSIPKGSLIFGYQTKITNLPDGVTYVSLNDDNKFIEANNKLTARAFREVVTQNYHGKLKKILFCGYGKLTTALEREFTDWKISVLNFNWHKMPEIIERYGKDAYFKTAPFHEFPIIVNTIPCNLIEVSSWQQCKLKQKIYDLASAPFGFDWRGVKQDEFDYNILPGLPGKFYPQEAAQAVFDCIQRYLEANAKPAVVLCVTGSACSFNKLIPILKNLVQAYDVYPVLSPNANTPNRFTDNISFQSEIKALTEHEIVTTIAGAERLSSLPNLRASIVFPATGNTLAKLTHGITDTCVLMAVKALLRNNKPCVIGLSTNDALGANAKNIGELLNRRNYFFVPFRQDQPSAKPNSCVCDFNQLIPTIDNALQGKQIQPVLLGVVD